jgi:uncharacterized integral membrane protein (TIGR00697 family)
MAPEFFYGLIVLTMYASLFAAALVGADALLVLMAMITITGNVIVGKILTVFGYQLNPGAGLAVGLFWIGSLLTQFYGVREAKKALWVNFASLVFLTVIGWLTMRVPGNVNPSMDAAVDTIFGFMPGVMVGAIASFGAAYLFNIFVQRKIQQRFPTLPALLQAGLVAAANLIDIAIFASIAYSGSGGNIGQIILMTWMVRLGVIIAGLPVILLIRHYYAKGVFPLKTS